LEQVSRPSMTVMSCDLHMSDAAADNLQPTIRTC
jgi:hypothetical protein